MPEHLFQSSMPPEGAQGVSKGRSHSTDQARDQEVKNG
jgi:hypothetical protein